MCECSLPRGFTLSLFCMLYSQGACDFPVSAAYTPKVPCHSSPSTEGAPDAVLCLSVFTGWTNRSSPGIGGSRRHPYTGLLDRLSDGSRVAGDPTGHGTHNPSRLYPLTGNAVRKGDRLFFQGGHHEHGAIQTELGSTRWTS